MNSRDPNNGPHDFKADIVSTESYTQPPNFFLNRLLVGEVKRREGGNDWRS